MASDNSSIRNNPSSENINGLPPEAGDAMLTCKVEAPNPLPCIVILIHGVNDIGEAFENQDNAICKGLNKRLGRCDLKANEWHKIQTKADNFSPRIAIKKSNYSPIVPFYWGYRPVSKEKYHEDQLAYEQRLNDPSVIDPELPYNSYWIERNIELKTEKASVNKLNCDKFFNWIDYNYHRNGGPFANATTCIPDMYGPGMEGPLGLMGDLFTPKGAKSYKNNPHRIYLAFAAYRLAKLIKQIRSDTGKQDIPINIVAHSQGTIITMLATLLLAKEEVLPADCVILAHSPYAFEPSVMEALSKDFGLGVQSQYGREQTFINFVNVMKKTQQDYRKKDFTREMLIKNGVISAEVKPDEKYTQADNSVKTYDRLGKDFYLFYRNNFGKVYNYFSPNDHVVSLRSVQGMGWQGIPDHIIKACQGNLKQRIFAQHVVVGNDTKNKEFNIPLIKIELTQHDYPEYINIKDYNERVTYVTVREGKAPNSVILLPEQLTKLKQEPLFKDREGTLEHGYYFNSGQKIAIYYKPTLSEMEKDYPEQYYETISSEQVEDICKKEERKLASGKKSGIVLKKNVSDSLIIASKQCNKYATGGASTSSFMLTKRIINGEEVPETIKYTVDEPSEKNELSRVIHYNDIYNFDPAFIERLKQTPRSAIIKRPDYIPPIKNIYDVLKQPLITDMILLQKLNNDFKLPDKEIKSFSYTNCDTMGKKIDGIILYYHLSQQHIQDEIRKMVEEDEDTSSHHSGITMHKEVPAKIMAYDLVIGEVNGILPQSQEKLYSWRVLADWRHPENIDNEISQYVNYGLLPKPLKDAMNYPKRHMPQSDDLVVNEFYDSPPWTKETAEAKTEEMMMPKYKKLSDKPQWPMPDPDLKE